jgi:hypothetical protein
MSQLPGVANAILDDRKIRYSGANGTKINLGTEARQLEALWKHR